MDETAVIALVRDGNTDAFGEIIEHYQMPIVRYLYKLTGDQSLAQDLAQDTFFQAYRSILKTNSHLSFKAWLYRIASNNARQYHRRKCVLSFIPFSDFRKQDFQSEEVFSDCVEEKMVIEEALLKVPYNQRICMVLHFVEGFKYKEIAQVIDTSEEAVRKRVARGSEVFRRECRLLPGGEIE